MKKILFWWGFVFFIIYLIFPYLDRQTQDRLRQSGNEGKSSLYRSWKAVNNFLYQMAGQSPDEAERSTAEFNGENEVPREETMSERIERMKKDR